MGPHEALQFIEELLLMKASIELINPVEKKEIKIKGDLLDYIDNKLVEYNKVVEDFEEWAEEEYSNTSRRIH
tara:strand:+ start:751 stop:966 length:216 start_codon:yes stop_codon:yes gene_type:complete